MEEKMFSYAETSQRREKQEEPVPVINVLDAEGCESLQHIVGKELSGNGSVDIDNRALRSKDCPAVIFGRPHAGEFIPQGLWERTTKESHETAVIVDRGTDFLFRSAKIPSVGTKMSRWIVDPNRAPMMDATNPNPKTPGKVLWREGIFGEQFYRPGDAPKDAEVADLVERFYLPYYNGMMATIASLTDRRKDKVGERILVIDGHSFVSATDLDSVYREHYRMTDAEIADLPAFILGDLDGQYCDGDIREAFIAALEESFAELTTVEQELLFKDLRSKKLISVNAPFKGVHNVRFYGQRSQGVNCIQLECNEDLYTDVSPDRMYRKSRYNQRKLELVRKLIERAVLKVDKTLKP